MALPFIKKVARRLSATGGKEQPVVPAPQEERAPAVERSKRPSRTNLRAFFGGGEGGSSQGRSGGIPSNDDSVAQQLRQIRSRTGELSKKELDAKLLEVIHMMDALSPARVDEVEGWEEKIGSMDLRAEAGMLGAPLLMGETPSSRAVILCDAAASNDVPRLRELLERP